MNRIIYTFGEDDGKAWGVIGATTHDTVPDWLYVPFAPRDATITVERRSHADRRGTATRTHDFLLARRYNTGRRTGDSIARDDLTTG